MKYFKMFLQKKKKKKKKTDFFLQFFIFFMKIISKFSYNNLFTNILGQKPYYYINLKLSDMYNIEEATNKFYSWVSIN